jgi:bifunctional DNA-binding transcriptional regulator/antitoxin component of YhaV-PrlF toxin-antitoxin module
MPTVTERKVVKFGGRALVITIPKAWSDYYGIEAGQQLRVVAGDVLTVHPPRKVADNEPAK